MPAKSKKPGQSNKDEILLVLRSLVPHGHVKTEHRFHPERMWRFDFAVPSLKIAVDYQGHAGFIPLTENGKIVRDSRGKPVQAPSGHSTIKGLTNDCEKSNAALSLGWQMFTFTALHFSEKGRKEHKLVSPYDVLKAAVAKALESTSLRPVETLEQTNLFT